MASIIDSYPESNFSGHGYGISGHISCWNTVGQSFTANGKKITSAKFYLSKSGPVTGNCYAKVYAHTGTWGVNGRGTGAALAVSGAVPVSSIGYGLVTFNFSGINQIELSDKVIYVIAFEYTVDIGGGNYIVAYVDLTSPTHTGNLRYKETNWGVLFPIVADLLFYVYSDDVVIARKAKNPFKPIFY